MHIYPLHFPQIARFLAHAMFVLALTLFLIPAAFAQSESGSAALEGTITDANQNAVPGATITVRNQETGYQRKLVTDARGQYLASVLPIGLYTVEVTATGFATIKRENLTLKVGNTETLIWRCR